MSVVSRRVRHPLLVSLVECLWWSAPARDHEVVRERILPTGRAQVIISSAADRSIVVGPRATSTDIERRDDRAMVGVSFQAGGVQPFLTVPAEELTDLTVDLGAIWRLGSTPDRVGELDAGPALDLVEAELVKRLCSERVSRPVLAAEQAIRAGIGAGEVSTLLGADRRRLVPEFRRTVGVAPKHYERIRRFNRSVAAMRRPRPPALAAIAAEVGYSDQAHMTREFTHFAGISPSHVIGDTSDAINHIAADKIFKT